LGGVVAILLILPLALSAQQPRSVSGRVTAATGKPLAGAQVSVKGTSVGTLTDANGRFTVQVPAGSDTLEVTFIGYRTQDVAITGPVVSVVMPVEAISLQGVVVTALGVTRQQRTLGYSVQQVQGDQLANMPQPNLVNSLQGRVAGVDITNDGPPGGSSRIVIRGANSLTGNNQPLFIVDGIPIDNSAPSNSGYGGIDYGNAAMDIDPSEIASISVLKGPNAAALYGSRAANGAVIITTKSGQNATGGQMTASTSVTYQTPLRLPTYQNRYGEGSTLYQAGCDSGCFSYVDGWGGGTFDYFDESWGPQMSGQLIDQWFGKQQPWTPHPNNVRNFFNTGRTWNTDVAFATSTEASHVRIAVGDQDISGMYPGNLLRRINAAVNGGIDITPRLSASGAINYINRKGVDRPGTGYDAGNVMEDFVWFGRQLDMNRLKNEYMCTTPAQVQQIDCTLGGQATWNNLYHNNPYFTALVDGNHDTRNRVIGHAQIHYKFTSWLTGLVRTGTDYYTDNRERDFAVTDNNYRQGAFFQDVITRQETNTDFLLTAAGDVAPSLHLTANVGGNTRLSDHNVDNVNVNQLAVPGIYSLQNAGVTPVVANHLYREKVNSLYGTAELTYNDYLTLDVTGRNDWSSTLPGQNNSYFYPSVSASFVFTDALGIASNTLPFGKLRASWARVGEDASPYQLVNTYAKTDPWSGLATFSVPNQLANANLKPEQTEAMEVGTDLKFFNSRAGLVATVYRKTTRNQILPAQVSTTSGYGSRVVNAGEIRNQGVELQLNGTPIVTKSGFRWDLNLNFGKNNNEVVSLAPGLDALVLGTYWYMNVEARPGQPYGQLIGYKWQRVPAGDPLAGDLILNSEGLPQRDPTKHVLGNYNPAWTAGLRTTFTYKGLSLSLLFDHKQGGQLFSATNWFGDYAGVLNETLKGRSISESQPGIVVNGAVPVTDSNGHVTGYNAVTDTVVSQAWFENYFYAHEWSVFDATFTKLREVTLTWAVPKKFVPLNFSSMTVSLIGHNLYLWTKVPHIDPETAFDNSNVQGLEFGQFPTARSIGFRIQIRP